MIDAGLLTLTAFISPYREDRDQVRELVEPGEFIEVYVKASLQSCEERDPKGLYKKAEQVKLKVLQELMRLMRNPSKRKLSSIQIN